MAGGTGYQRDVAEGRVNHLGIHMIEIDEGVGYTMAPTLLSALSGRIKDLGRQTHVTVPWDAYLARIGSWGALPGTIIVP